MASQRKAIRAAIVTALKNASIVGQSVYPNRWLPTWEGELPAIFVYTDDESSANFNLAPREYKRECSIVTEIIMSADVGLDDALDDAAALVEAAIATDPQLGANADDTFLKSTQLELFSNGDALMGSLKITWDVRYYTQLPGDLSGALPYFANRDVKIQPESPGGNALIEDTGTQS